MKVADLWLGVASDRRCWNISGLHALCRLQYSYLALWWATKVAAAVICQTLEAEIVSRNQTLSRFFVCDLRYNSGRKPETIIALALIA